jgi:hypothetical protein
MSFLRKLLSKNRSSYYESEIDKFLLKLGHRYPKKSPSQRHESTKHERIAYLRDHKQN